MNSLEDKKETRNPPVRKGIRIPSLCFPLGTVPLMLELEDEFMLPKHFPKEAMC